MGHQDGPDGDLSDPIDRGMACIDRNQPADALEYLNAAVAANPACAKAFCARGTAFRMLGQVAEARRNYDTALTLDPEYARAYFNLGLLRFEQGETEDAFRDFSRAMNLNAEPGFYYHRGTCYLQLERHELAIADFNECLRLDPHPATHFHRGIAYTHLNSLSEAISDFDVAIEAGYALPKSLHWKAHALVLQKQFEKAVNCLDRAIELESTNPELFAMRGSAHYQCNEAEPAVHDYDTAIEHDSDNANHYYSRGLAWARLSDYDAAIADFTSAIDRQDNHFPAHWARGDAYLDIAEFNLALHDLTRAIDLNPEEPFPYVLRARTRRAIGQDDLALADLNQAILSCPKLKRGLEVRCELFVDLGRHEAAEADLDTLAQLELDSIQELDMTQRKTRISMLLAEHFAPASVSELAITVRKFPFRVRADLHRAIDRLFDTSVQVSNFFGVKKNRSYESMMLADLLYSDPHDAALAVPPQYEELDIGEAEPIRCIRNGIWLAEQDGQKFAVLLAPALRHGDAVGLQFQIAVLQGEEGVRITQQFFKHLEDAVLRSESYRGKILSLEVKDYYSGMTAGICVHKLRTVDREQVILPKSTLDLLDRNIIQFAQQRSRLAKFGLSTKKGLLFYGPPGTGKTHTIHYLAGAMTGHTTLLITAEQVGLLSDYMTLARLLQPSIVVIEDADLIARDRNQMESPCEEVLLNKLLNEMDGLRPDTDVFFILTTNRPAALEAALASRPGRIDQAIEFPLPDAEGRRKLVRLYSRGMVVPDDVVEATVNRTDRVSASFIKELMRRAAQFHLERTDATHICLEDIDLALNELLFAGGTLNRTLLGMQAELS